MSNQRDAIETCIKEFSIDRNRFFETSKQSYKIIDNWDWVNQLPNIVPDSNSPVYVLFEDTKDLKPKYWLYEAYVNELMIVLNECVLWGDFYIVSKKFCWLISLNHHDIISCIGESMNLDCIEIN